MDEDRSDAPLPEAYGLVTNPERFRSLHDLGRRAVLELVSRDENTRVDFTEPDRFGSEPAAGVRLTPIRLPLR